MKAANNNPTFIMKPFFLLSGIVMMFTSCITHVCDTFFNKAEYEAYGDTSTICPNQNMYVLSNGKDYFIELQRMRKDNRPDTSDYGSYRGLAFYSIRDEKIDGEADLYRLPKQHALYIIGKNNHPVSAGKLTYVENADEVKAGCTQRFPVKRAPEYWCFNTGLRTVASPHAGIYNTLGYTTAVVVDVPLSCIGTASAVAFNAIVWPVYFIIYPNDAIHAFSADFGSKAWQDFINLR